ncbi:MAG: HigA family addiction module antitoxin [Bacteroidales bacterium]|nr:HigA family addiction module antitoxin [Bacteroidales bacterium]
MAKNALEMAAFRAFHPGELLKDEIEYRGIKQRDFADAIGVSPTVVNEILNGKRGISAEFALMAEAALGVSADMLVRMQSDYNLEQTRSNPSLLERIRSIQKVASVL